MATAVDENVALIDIEGFDPLSFDASDEVTARLLEDQSRRIVNNILKSYTGYFDVFSELIQNALDATEAKAKTAGSGYVPKIWIDIDIQNSRLRVTDNGIGMGLHELKYFVKPNVSFKPAKEYRGQKGVGATFLAYGFSFIRGTTAMRTRFCCARAVSGHRTRVILSLGLSSSEIRLVCHTWGPVKTAQVSRLSSAELPVSGRNGSTGSVHAQRSSGSTCLGSRHH